MKLKPQSQRVWVYRNLNPKRERYSVQSREGVDYGRVIARANYLTLKNCTFTVGSKGRQRVLEERRKNVHAGVLGTIVRSDKRRLDGAIRVSYNPYQSEHFVTAKGNVIHKADFVIFTDHGVYVKGI